MALTQRQQQLLQVAKQKKAAGDPEFADLDLNALEQKAVAKNANTARASGQISTPPTSFSGQATTNPLQQIFPNQPGRALNQVGRDASENQEVQRLQQQTQPPQAQQQAPVQAPSQQEQLMQLIKMAQGLDTPQRQTHPLMQTISNALIRGGGGTPTAKAQPKESLSQGIIKTALGEKAKNIFETEEEKAIRKGKLISSLREQGRFDEVAQLLGEDSGPGDSQQQSGDDVMTFEQETPDRITGLVNPGAKARNAARARFLMQEQVDRAKALSDSKKLTRASRLIEADLDDVLEEFKSVPGSVRGPIQGRSVGLAAEFFQVGKGGKSLAEYNDTVDFILSNIARQLGGERGVLTDKDIERVRKALPLRRDTDDVAGGKIKRIKRFIARRVEERQTGRKIDGEDLAEFGDDLKTATGGEGDDLNNLSLEQLQSIAREEGANNG